MAGWAHSSLSLERVSGGVDEGGKSIRCDFQMQRKETLGTWCLQRTVMIRKRSTEGKREAKREEGKSKPGNYLVPATGTQ